LLALVVLAVVSRLAPGPVGAAGTLLVERATRDGRVNLHRIMGARGSFLWLGLMFSQACRLLALCLPQAFAIVGAPAGASAMEHKYAHFSVITLTSTGFGDVTPIHPYARSLATFEAIVGQLCIAALIARLIGLEIEWCRERREAAPTPWRTAPGVPAIEGRNNPVVGQGAGPAPGLFLPGVSGS
jgi:hypothetical protein